MKKYAQLPAQCLSLAASTPASVLLQTLRPDEENYRSYLFVHPSQTLLADDALFQKIDHALAAGSWVAGYFSYECGEGLQNLSRCPAQDSVQDSKLPRAWFGVYPEVLVFNHRTGEFEGNAPDSSILQHPQPPQSFEIRNLRLGIDEASYARKVAAIQEHIRAGDTYQANFTDRLRFDFCGSPQAMFAALAESQPVAYSAFLREADWHILSFSPELFFRVNDRRILTRPMKGTAQRGADIAEDERIANWLHNDPKNRSENVMIVDLLRNDLGRICEYGSVRAEQLFSVEKYETLFQMTSEVSGTLRPEVCYAEIFRSLFPCGSVTGAPKHRTLEIIRQLERGPRGVYTGAIGFFSPAREAVFNVPIRTIVLRDDQGAMGVGSGIVMDSQADHEYRECLLKSEFLTNCEAPFQLLESILWDNGYRRLSAHLERMEASAAYWGFDFDRAVILAALDEESNRLPCGVSIKVRVLLARSGIVTVTHAPVQQEETGEAIISAQRVFSGDRFLRHKTTRRQHYDRQYAEARELGYDEVLFLNERGEVTEGAISNVFIEKEGQWFTPPVDCGLLPGIYRRHLLETKPAREKVIYPHDLVAADAVYICNAVRGCRKVKIALSTFDQAQPLPGQMQ